MVLVDIHMCGQLCRLEVHLYEVSLVAVSACADL